MIRTRSPDGVADVADGPRRRRHASRAVKIHAANDIPLEAMQMTSAGAARVRTGARAAAIVLLSAAVLALPAGARAGDYTIHNCPGSLQPNDDAGSWRMWSNGSLPSAGGYQGSCTPGGAIGGAIGWYGIEQSFNTSLGAELATPSSAISIVSLRLVWSGAGKSSGSDTFGQVNSDTGSEIAHEAPFAVASATPDVVDFPDATHTIYVDSFCSTDGSTNCYFAANTTPVIALEGMDTTLAESNPPTATISAGSLAGAGPVSGIGTLDFTATDGESGVLESQLLVDGSPVVADSYAAHCPYTDFAACPLSMPDSIAWDTRAVTDGMHQLALRIVDAAGNIQTVDDHAVMISNPTITPVPRRRGEVKARFIAVWHWHGAHTRLTSIRAERLPRHALITIACRGKGCPRLRGRQARAASIGRLRHDLEGRRFRAGDRLELTVTAAGLDPERIEFTIRAGARPAARLV
jgi:hypothetical protein